MTHIVSSSDKEIRLYYTFICDSVTSENIIYFLTAFIPTPYPPPTHPEVRLIILPSHIVLTLLSMELRKHLFTCSFVLHFCKIFLSRINSECNQQVTLFFSTAYLQYVNHGCNDVRSSLFPSIGAPHTRSHTPTQPSPPGFSAGFRPVCLPAGATVLVQR